MKKIVAMMLALILVLSMASVAMAATPTPTTAINRNIPKVYTVTYVGGNVKLPADDITFAAELTSITNSTREVTDALKNQYKATIAYTNPAETDVTVATSNNQGTGNLTVSLPSYDQVGVYLYKVTETSSKNPAGVEYQGDVYMKVIVIQGTDGLEIGSVSFRTEADADNEKHDDENGQPETTKLGEITNAYKAGDLTISKEVKGNMGEQARLFEITVTFTSEKKVYGTVTITKTGTAVVASIGGTTGDATTIAAETEGWTEKAVVFKLAHNDTIKFENLPEGVTYTVAETDSTIAADDYESEIDTASGAISSGAEKTAKVTNTKDITVDTGIALETVPYVMILAVAMMGAAMMIIRRRKEDM